MRDSVTRIASASPAALPRLLAYRIRRETAGSASPATRRFSETRDRFGRFCRQREAAASANAKAGTTSTGVATELAMKQLSSISRLALAHELRSRLNRGDEQP